MSPHVRLAGAEARLEDPLPVVRVDARAVVADVEQHLTDNSPYLQRDAVSGETGSVLEQRREDALHDVALDGYLHPSPAHELDLLTLGREGLRQGCSYPFGRCSRVACRGAGGHRCASGCEQRLEHALEVLRMARNRL